MINQNAYDCDLDFIVTPGDTLLETIESLDITQAELARRTGRTVKLINEIIKGKAPISADTAIQLEKVLGIPASFWNNLEKKYQEEISECKHKKELESCTGWLNKFPIKSMIREKYINKMDNDVDQLSELLSFFGVASPKSWDTLWDTKVQFRQSPTFESDKYAVITYLRKAEIEATKIKCSPYDKEKFSTAISELRNLTNETDPQNFVPQLINTCAAAGVAIVFLPELKGTHLSGATKWLSPNKAMIVLSLRHKRNDHLWFTFFHESGHVILHAKKKVFIESNKHLPEVNAEKEADNFAANVLIPKDEYKSFVEKHGSIISARDVASFAKSINIHPGIVVGRLQRDEVIPYRNLNRLIIFYKWDEWGDPKQHF
jgi:addiction module HigA family antidote